MCLSLSLFSSSLLFHVPNFALTPALSPPSVSLNVFFLFWLPKPLPGNGRIRALCDKLLLVSDGLGNHGSGGGEPDLQIMLGGGGGGGLKASGGLLGLHLCDGPSVLGLNKLHLLKEVSRTMS